MKKFCYYLSITILVFASLSSCALKENGNSLGVFVTRLNSLDEDYNITQKGFIVDEDKKQISGLFAFSENELLIMFTYSEKNELSSLNIVFDNIQTNNSEELKFIKNVISAFLNNEGTEKALLHEIDLENTLTTTDINTKKAKIGNAEMLIDVTEIGTVITVLQNTP